MIEIIIFKIFQDLLGIGDWYPIPNINYVKKSVNFLLNI